MHEDGPVGARGFPVRRTAQRAGDLAHHGLRKAGLEQHALDPGSLGTDRQIRRGVAGHHDDADTRGARIRLEPLGDREAVDVRQDVVSEEDVRNDLDGRRDRLRTGDGFGRAVSIRIETRAIELTRIQIVVDDQDERLPAT